MAALSTLFDENIFNKQNEKVDLKDEKYKGKVFGLYFSANWCPPCRGFTPILIEFYKSYAEEKNLEIIFISSDRNKNAFEDYYKEMPWLTLDYEDRKKKDDLTKQYQITGIPTLILFDGDSGEILCQDARDEIQHKDTKGERFPWKSS